MRAIKLILLLGMLLAVPGVRATEGSILPPGCPANPSMCTYASAEFRVGPLRVTIEARADEDSGTLEQNVTLAPGEGATITIGVAANSSAANQTFAVAFQVNATEGVTWEGAQNASFTYAPTPGVSETREFRFVVDDDAPGELPVPILIHVDDEIGFTYVTFGVVRESVPTAQTPGAPLALALVLVAGIALIWRRER